MTISSTNSRAIYEGNGSATVFDITFPYLNDSNNLAVYHRGADGTQTLLTEGTDYSVDTSADTVTYPLSGDPLPSGEYLAILRELPAVQELDLVNNDPFDANLIEQAFDRNTMLAQQTEEKVDRAMVYDESTPSSEVLDASEFDAKMNGYASDAESARDTAQTYRDEAYDWAEADVDVDVSDTAGHSGKSAYHHSDVSRRYANEDQGVEVEPGYYSAKHYMEETSDLLDQELEKVWWHKESSAVAYASSSTFTVTGDKTGVYVEYRAVRLTQDADATGHVLSSSYDSGADKTTVEVSCTVDSGLSEVEYGQDLDSAPDETGKAIGEIPRYEEDGDSNPIIDFPSKDSQMALISAAEPGHYKRDVRWAVKGNTTEAERRTLVSPNRLTVNVGDEGYILPSQIELDLSDAASWDDTSATDWTVAANRAGKDFYRYACKPASGRVVDIIVSANSTIPDSIPSGETPTSDNTRKIGGFHCLCADVGSSVANPADDPPLDELNKALLNHDITGNTHWMSGFVAGDILPFSVWDLIHRPADWSPEGMYFDALSKKWLFIYLASWDGQQMVSAFEATIVDGDSSPAFHWYNFDELLPGLPFQGTFSKASRGSPQAVNIDGGSDPGTTGGHSATDGNRIISLCGGEDMTGVLWQWGAEGGATNDVGSSWEAADTNGTAGTYDDDHNIDRGEHYEAPNRPRFGGPWGDGSTCGSRGSRWRYSPVDLNSDCGARGVAEPKSVDR